MKDFIHKVGQFLNSKNIFTNFFAFYTFTLAFGAAIVMIYRTIPKDNQRLADVFFGTVIGVVISTVMNYKFGSSASSKSKDDLIENLTKKKDEEQQGK